MGQRMTKLTKVKRVRWGRARSGAARGGGGSVRGVSMRGGLLTTHLAQYNEIKPCEMGQGQGEKQRWEGWWRRRAGGTTAWLSLAMGRFTPGGRALMASWYLPLCSAKYICMLLHRCICMYISIDMHINICIYVCMFIYMYVHVYVYVYIYTYV